MKKITKPDNQCEVCKCIADPTTNSDGSIREYKPSKGNTLYTCTKCTFVYANMYEDQVQKMAKFNKLPKWKQKKILNGG